MDKNQFIGLLLMFALLGIYFVYFSPNPNTLPQSGIEDTTQTSLINNNQIRNELANAPVDSSTKKTIQKDSVAFGVFSPFITTETREFIVETDLLKIIFSNQGGIITDVYLKKHKDYLGNTLHLMDKSKSKIDFEIPYKSGKIYMSQLTFQPVITENEEDFTVNFMLSSPDITIQQQYVVTKTSYKVDYQFSSKGLDKIMDDEVINYTWNHSILRLENNLEDSRYNSNIRFLTSQSGYDETNQRSSDKEELLIEEPIRWITFKQKFFSTGIVSNATFLKGYTATSIENNLDSSVVKNGIVKAQISKSSFLKNFDLSYYFGPNNYTILKKITEDFEKNLDMGWGPLPVVNKYLIIPIFHFLEKFISSYGLIIFILVIIIRLLLSPLTYKSHISMAKMRVLKPELDEIKGRHEGNMQKAQKEQMQLYQKVGINPLSGCIPMLLQMPILFSLFFFFPNAIELRQESLLWATDLSTYDSILKLPFFIPFYGDHVSLFTLLMTASTLLITVSNSQMSSIQGPMKTLQYIMPIMFLFVLNNYSSGLTYYYFLSNMLTFGQTLLFKRMIDEDKIKSVLEKNRKSNANKKKSKFQQRLEDVMKAGEERKKQKKQSGK